MSYRIQIVILSRDREQYIKETLDSVLNQKVEKNDVEVIVSDNSETDKVENLIKHSFSDSGVKYVRRYPTLTATDHCKIVVSELDGDYSVLFHDDDIMKPNFIQRMTSSFTSDNIVAIGCNSSIFKTDIKTFENKPHNYKYPHEFFSNKDFLEQYLPGFAWIAPLPGYVYKTSALKKATFKTVRAPNEISDVVLLNSLLKYGSIKWIPENLMFYRLHDSNESNKVRVPGKLTILRLMIKSGINKKNPRLIMFRCGFWLKWLLQNGVKNLLKKKNRIVFLFLMVNFLRLSTKIIFWKTLFDKNTFRYFFK